MTKIKFFCKQYTPTPGVTYLVTCERIPVVDPDCFFEGVVKYKGCSQPHDQVYESEAFIVLDVGKSSVKLYENHKYSRVVTSSGIVGYINEVNFSEDVLIPIE